MRHAGGVDDFDEVRRYDVVEEIDPGGRENSSVR
jgi:hypothetical protein